MAEKKSDTGSVESLVKRLSNPGSIHFLKQSKRTEVIEGLSWLLTQALEEARKIKKDVRLQQKWFTIAAYLSQVMGKITRDLEFERLRAEVNALNQRVDQEIVLKQLRRTGKADSSDRSETHSALSDETNPS